MVSNASKLLDDARTTGDRRCTPQSRYLRGKAAGITLGAPDQHLRRRQRAACVPQQNGGRHGRTDDDGKPGEETLSVTVSVSWAIKAQ